MSARAFSFVWHEFCAIIFNMNKNAASKTAFTAFEWLDSIVFSLSVVLLLFTFVIKTYTVQGVSMEPTFHTGERIFALDFLYEPKQGDVVIIDANNSLSEPLIKRVVAVAGQSVDIDRESGALTVDGVEFSDPIAAGADNLRGDTAFPVTVPEGCIFVMGDNRGASLDSRYSALGFVDARSVVGREVLSMGGGNG